MKNNQNIVEGGIYHLISFKEYENEWIDCNKLIYIFYVSESDSLVRFEYLDGNFKTGRFNHDEIRVKPISLIEDLMKL